MCERQGSISDVRRSSADMVGLHQWRPSRMGVVAHAGLRRHHPLTRLEIARRSFLCNIRIKGRRVTAHYCSANEAACHGPDLARQRTASALLRPRA